MQWPSAGPVVLASDLGSVLSFVFLGKEDGMFLRRVVAVSVLVFVSQLAAQDVILVGISNKEGDGSKSYDAKVMMEVLDETEDAEAEYVSALALEGALEYDVIVLPYGGAEVGDALYPYVATGGGLLTSFSYTGGGYPPATSDPMFPAVACVGVNYRFMKRWERYKSNVFKPVIEHPLAEGIDRIMPITKLWGGTNVALMIQAGPNGKIVFADPKIPYLGVVVTGEYGCGKIVQTARPFSLVEKQDEPEEGMAKLLVNSVRYLAKAKWDKKKATAYGNGKLSEARTLLSDRDARVRGRLKALPDGMDKNDVEALKVTDTLDGLRKELEGIEEALKGAENRPEYASALLPLRPLRTRIKADTLRLVLELDKLKNAHLLANKEPLTRELPKYPRAVCHVLQILDMKPKESIVEKHLREAAEELGANMLCGNVKSHRQKQWLMKEDLMDWYFRYAEAYGLKVMLWSADAALPGLREQKPLDMYLKYPAFIGFMNDEPLYYFGAGNYNIKYYSAQEREMRFRGFLKDNYSLAQRKEWGIDADTVKSSWDYRKADAIREILNTKNKAERRCWMLAGEFAKEEITRIVSQGLKYVKEREPDLTTWVNLNMFQWSGYPQSLLSLAGECDVVGFDPYTGGAMQECVRMSLARAATDGRVWGVAWAGGEYITDQRLFKRHLYNISMYSDGLCLFAWSGMYKHQQGWSNQRMAWAPGYWEQSREVFHDLKALEDYLVDRKSVAKVAILASERTIWGNYYVWPWGMQPTENLRYYRNLVGVFAAMAQLHVPVDFIFAERLDHLDRYSVLIAPTAECLTSEEAGRLEEWVRKGGTVIATAKTAKYDRFGIEQEEYALKHVFNVKSSETKQGAAQITMCDDHPLLSSLKSGSVVSYTGGASGAAKLEPTYEALALPDPPGAAKVIGRYADDSPAIVASECGKGAAVFMGATYLGLSYKGGFSRWDKKDRFQFGQGVLALLGDCVRWGLRRSEALEPVLLDADLPEIMIHLTQQGESRLILEFLDYRPDVYTLDKAKAPSLIFKGGVPADCLQSQAHNGFGCRVLIPQDWGSSKVRVVDPRSGKTLDSRVVDGYVAFTVDEFTLYTMVVIERQD